MGGSICIEVEMFSNPLFSGGVIEPETIAAAIFLPTLGLSRRALWRATPTPREWKQQILHPSVSPSKQDKSSVPCFVERSLVTVQERDFANIAQTKEIAYDVVIVDGDTEVPEANRKMGFAPLEVECITSYNIINIFQV